MNEESSSGDPRSHKRGDALAGLGLFLVALTALIWVSAHTAPAFSELALLREETRAFDVVRQVAQSGVSALWSHQAAAVFGSFKGRTTLLVLLGGWSRLSIGRLGLLDPLSSMRLPWLVLAALGVVALYALALPSLGRRQAALAALLLALMPRWLHGAAISSLGAAAASCWLLILVAYLRSLGPAQLGADRSRKRSLCWSVCTAAAVGFGLAVSSMTLWVLPVILLHFWFTRHAATRRLLRRGRVPVPTFVLFALLATPAACLLFNPALWRDDLVSIARWLLAPLSPTVKATQYAGVLVDGPPVPGGYTARWLFDTLPAVVLVCALVGLGAFLHRALGRRFATGALRPPRDRHALGGLVTIALAFTVFGPFVCPTVLTTFPPPVELSLPFVALSAGVGLDRVAAVAAMTRWGKWVEFAVVALIGVLSLKSPGTLSASFDELLGGARRVLADGSFAAGDGSELGILARHIDSLERPQISLLAPGVPPGMWGAMHDSGWLRTAVVSAAVERPGQLVLERGPRTGRALFEVKRDGTTLWALTRSP